MVIWLPYEEITFFFQRGPHVGSFFFRQNHQLFQPTINRSNHQPFNHQPFQPPTVLKMNHVWSFFLGVSWTFVFLGPFLLVFLGPLCFWDRRTNQRWWWGLVRICYQNRHNTLECEQLDPIQEVFCGVSWEREKTWVKYQQNLVNAVIERSHYLGNGGATLT